VFTVYREHSIGVRGAEELTSDYVLTVQYKASPLVLGKDAWAYINQGCTDSFYFVSSDQKYEELLLTATPTEQVDDNTVPVNPVESKTFVPDVTFSNPYRQYDLWSSTQRLFPNRMSGLTSNNTALNTVTYPSGDVSIGVNYVTAKLRPEGYKQYKSCVKSYGIGDTTEIACLDDSDCTKGSKCMPRMWCHMGASYGNGRLEGSYCSSSYDCMALEPGQFRCQRSTGKCLYGHDKVKFKEIAFWNTYAIDCKFDSQCSSEYVKSKLICAGPSVNIAVLATEYTQPKVTKVLKGGPGELKHLLAPNCAPGATLDITVGQPAHHTNPHVSLNLSLAIPGGTDAAGPKVTQGLGDGKLFISDKFEPGRTLDKASWCAGGNCYCRAGAAFGSKRLVGSKCQLHSDCGGIDPSRIRCHTDTPRTCQFMAIGSTDWADIGEQPDSFTGSMPCAQTSYCQVKPHT